MWFLALAAYQAISGIQNASIARKNGDLQGKIADMNAKFAEYDAFNERATGQTNAARYAEQVQQTQSAGKAAYASEGVDVNYGTAKNVETSNQVAATTNALQIQRQASNKAMGLQNQAINIRVGGQTAVLQSRLNASAQENAGIMNAVNTGVSGYAYSQSTGKGTASRTGEDSKPQYDRPINMSLSSDGQKITGYGRGSSFTDEVG